MKAPDSTVNKKPKRLLALDILRGITIAGMILVNNPGTWGSMYAPLRHAEWNGLTPTDLVFPFFMFIMGVSTYFSMRKFDFELSWASAFKILRRSVVIYAIGIFIGWFSKFLYGIPRNESIFEAAMCFDTIRFLGVMPRLALCYCFGSFAVLLLKPKRLPIFISILLVGYALVLLLGNGLVFSESNVLAVVDRHVLGTDHMYTENIGGERLKFEPEGLLGTIPSIAHMLIGFMCGAMLMRTKDNEKRINTLFIVGTILTFCGFLLDYGIPINKKIWSPTFVLTTCGLASLLLGLLIWIIDIRGYRKWCRFFEAFGVNPLFMYCCGSVLSIIFGAVRFGDKTIHGFIYKDCIIPLCGDNSQLSSLLYALLFIIVNWLIAYYLYKKKIYIKI